MYCSIKGVAGKKGRTKIHCHNLLELRSFFFKVGEFSLLALDLSEWTAHGTSKRKGKAEQNGEGRLTMRAPYLIGFVSIEERIVTNCTSHENSAQVSIFIHSQFSSERSLEH